uniref:U-box domain-containing protein n=1 Tax=Cucumis melo TaxID=3656 RepID=A0A9I9EHY7_CUCME
MNDPCVAADGYTYDRQAIEKWLQKNDNSPMTKLPLPDKNLIPNYSLLSAIVEWNSKRISKFNESKKRKTQQPPSNSLPRARRHTHSRAADRVCPVVVRPSPPASFCIFFSLYFPDPHGFLQLHTTTVVLSYCLPRCRRWICG